MSEANVEAVRQFYDRVAGGDFWGGGRELFDSEIEWEWSPSFAVIGGGPYHGLEAVTAATRDLLTSFDWFWIEAEDFVDAGDRVVALVTHKGRPKGGDHHTENRGAEVWTLRDGKAIAFKAYDDREEALRAVGLAT